MCGAVERQNADPCQGRVAGPNDKIRLGKFRLKTPVTIRYDRRLVPSIVSTYWWHRTGWSYVAAMVVLAGFLLYLLANGDRSWFVGAIGSALAF